MRRFLSVLAGLLLAGSLHAVTRNFYTAKAAAGAGDCSSEAAACRFGPTTGTLWDQISVLDTSDDVVIWLTTTTNNGYSVDSSGVWTGDDSMLVVPTSGDAVEYCLNGAHSAGATVLSLKECTAGGTPRSGSFPENTEVYLGTTMHRLASSTTSGGFYTTLTLRSPGLNQSYGNGASVKSAGLSGRSGHPIIIQSESIPAPADDRTVNVLVNAEETLNRYAIRLSSSDYIQFKGVDAANTVNRAVVTVGCSNAPCPNLVFEDVAAWDGAEEYSNYVWSFASNTTNAIGVTAVRVAGWGSGRKTWQWFQVPNTSATSAEVQIGLFRWEHNEQGCTGTDSPKMPFSFAYESFRAKCNNCFALWSAEEMPQSFVPNSGGSPPPDCSETMNNYKVPPTGYGLFTSDGNDNDAQYHGGLYGSAALMLAQDPYDQRWLPRNVFIKEVTHFEIKDVLSYIPPGSFTPSQTGRETTDFSTKRNFLLGGCTVNAAICGDTAADENTADSITSLGGMSDSFATSGTGNGAWNITNNKRVTDSSSAGMAAAGVNVYEGSGQANLCHPYRNGVEITAETLWDKIPAKRWAKAMTYSVHSSINITSLFQDLFGAIPSNCGNPQPPTPTPTVTATTLPTNTPTFTPSNTRTATPTPTRTNTPTVTLTFTPSHTHTPVPTNTPPAPTFTQTPTFSATPTQTPTVPTHTPTVTRTPNRTPVGSACNESHEDIIRKVDPATGRVLATYRQWVPPHAYDCRIHPPHELTLVEVTPTPSNTPTRTPTP